MNAQRIRKTILFLSLLAFPVTFNYLSPFLAMWGTYNGVVSSGLLFWGIVTLTSPILGRAFCSHLCPLGGLQDGLDAALGKPLSKVKYLQVTKYLLWAAWAGGIVWLAVVAGGYSRVDVFFENPGFPPYDRQAHIAFTAFVSVTALAGMLLGKRAFCRYLCFFSPGQIAGAQAGRACGIPRLHVQVMRPDDCLDCHLCDKACPMSLDVQAMVRQASISSPECITCGACAAACRNGVLRFGYSGGPDRTRARPQS